jgi:hypothetical protein
VADQLGHLLADGLVSEDEEDGAGGDVLGEVLTRKRLRSG